jgi:hypothetical protein
MSLPLTSTLVLVLFPFICWNDSALYRGTVPSSVSKGPSALLILAATLHLRAGLRKFALPATLSIFPRLDSSLSLSVTRLKKALKLSCISVGKSRKL